MKHFLKKGKGKASIFDVLGLIIVIPFILFIILVFYVAYSSTANGLENFQSSNTQITGINESTETFTENSNKYPSFFDFIGIFIIFMIWLSIFISAFILGNNPIFLVIYIITSLALIVVSIVLEIALSEFVSNILIASYMVSFPMLSFVIDKFFIFALFFIVSVGIALYFKLGGIQ